MKLTFPQLIFIFFVTYSDSVKNLGKFDCSLAQHFSRHLSTKCSSKHKHKLIYRTCNREEDFLTWKGNKELWKWYETGRCFMRVRFNVKTNIKLVGTRHCPYFQDFIGGGCADTLWKRRRCKTPEIYCVRFYLGTRFRYRITLFNLFIWYGKF